MRRPERSRRRRDSPALLSLPDHGPRTPVMPEADWRAAGLLERTRKPLALMTVPVGKVKLAPPVSCQPVRSTSMLRRLRSSIHSGSVGAAGWYWISLMTAAASRATACGITSGKAREAARTTESKGEGEFMGELGTW